MVAPGVGSNSEVEEDLIGQARIGKLVRGVISTILDKEG